METEGQGDLVAPKMIPWWVYFAAGYGFPLLVVTITVIIVLATDLQGYGTHDA